MKMNRRDLLAGIGDEICQQPEVYPANGRRKILSSLGNPILITEAITGHIGHRI
jgi:hypothetical protein